MALLAYPGTETVGTAAGSSTGTYAPYSPPPPQPIPSAYVPASQPLIVETVPAQPAILPPPPPAVGGGPVPILPPPPTLGGNTGPTAIPIASPPPVLKAAVPNVQGCGCLTSRVPLGMPSQAGAAASPPPASAPAAAPASSSWWWWLVAVVLLALIIRS